MVEFIVVPNSYTVKAKPRQDYEEEDPLPTIPWLDVLVCSCNCSSFPRIGNIVVNANNGNTENPYELELSDDCESEEDIPGDIEVSIQESDSDEQDDNDNNYAGAAANDDNDDGNQCVEDITEKFTEYFALKGSSYHEDCQKALKRCKQLQLSKQDIEMRVNPEPTNIRDKNAILVEAHLDGEWSRVGYIQKEKIRKVTAAIKNNEIDNVRFKSIGFMFIPDLNDWLYQPRILITKSHRWLPTDANYKYNDNLD